MLIRNIDLSFEDGIDLVQSQTKVAERKELACLCLHLEIWKYFQSRRTEVSVTESASVLSQMGKIENYHTYLTDKMNFTHILPHDVPVFPLLSHLKGRIRVCKHL